MASAGSLPRVVLFSGAFELRGRCTYTLRLAEMLPDFGYSPQVITPDARCLHPQVRRDLRILEMPELKIPLWNRVGLEMLARDWKVHPPDLIHIQSRSALSQGRWLARRIKRPYVLTVHDYLQSHEAMKIDPSACRQVVAVSDSVKLDLLRRTGVPDSLVTVVHSGVRSPASLDDIPEALPAGRRHVIGAAGPLEPNKGFPYFLTAGAMVRERHPNVELMIAGAGPEERSLRRMARELGLVDCATFVPNLLDFADAIEAMDIFCLPSLQQGLGTVMLEAMAFGRPVIATRVGGVHQIVRDGETGLLVPPASSQALADAMSALLSNPIRARELGAAAHRDVSSKFSVKRMLADTASVYAHALELRDPSLAATRMIAANGRL